MGNQARNYTDMTLKRLFGLSGNQCAFPGCAKQLVNTTNAKDSNICHIEAANEDGERYNSAMTDKQRADYSNLILLCVQHHDKTNNETIYTIEVLQEMKQNHESNISHKLLNEKPSMLINAINAISSIDIEEVEENQSLRIIDPAEKIKYNSIKRNASLIEEYKVYHSKINSLYDELEAQGSIKKEKLLSNIRLIYTKIKGNYVLDSENGIEIIKKNSDDIIDAIINELYSKLEKSTLFEEDIILGINLIIVDAFVRCKILEEPK